MTILELVRNWIVSQVEVPGIQAAIELHKYIAEGVSKLGIGDPPSFKFLEEAVEEYQSKEMLNPRELKQLPPDIKLQLTSDLADALYRIGVLTGKYQSSSGQPPQENGRVDFAAPLENLKESLLHVVGLPEE